MMMAAAAAAVAWSGVTAATPREVDGVSVGVVFEGRDGAAGLELLMLLLRNLGLRNQLL